MYYRQSNALTLSATQSSTETLLFSGGSRATHLLRLVPAALMAIYVSPTGYALTTVAMVDSPPKAARIRDGLHRVVLSSAVVPLVSRRIMSRSGCANPSGTLLTSAATVQTPGVAWRRWQATKLLVALRWLQYTIAFVVVNVCLFLLYQDYSTNIASFIGANSV